MKEETGTVENFDGGTVITGTGIELAQMVIVRAALRREQAGFKRGSGRSVKSKWAEHFGLDKRAGYADIIARVEERIRQLEPTINRGGELPGAQGDPEIPEPRVTETNW